MAMTSKAKKPEVVMNPATAEHYKKYGNTFVAEGHTEIGYRYDHIQGRKMRKPNGKEFTNNVTLSQHSTQILTLMKENDNWSLVLGKQSRSPYLVEVDGVIFSKIFFEQAGGLVEANQDFQSTALAEVQQELGAKVVYLGNLIVPKVCQHVSYTDETSHLYLAVAQKLDEQQLDEEESINVDVIPLEKAKQEFKDYINGKKENFFGFEIPDMTMLSMSLFFWKLDTGEIDLNNLTGNLL